MNFVNIIAIIFAFQLMKIIIENEYHQHNEWSINGDVADEVEFFSYQPQQVNNSNYTDYSFFVAKTSKNKACGLYSKMFRRRGTVFLCGRAVPYSNPI